VVWSAGGLPGKENVMSYTFICDYCGAMIEDEDWVTLDTTGHGWGAKRRSGYVGHYHDDEAKPCFDEIWSAIKLVRDYGEVIEAIPVASGQKIASERSKHTKPEGSDVEIPSGGTSKEDRKRGAAGTPLWRLPDGSEITFRARIALKDGGISCLEDAADWTSDELLALHGVGQGTLTRLRKALDELGLSFKEDPDAS
jgi:hypothetical protein